MCSRCFAGRYQTALLAVASTASPTGSPKSSVKPATSRHPENGQRLAANADYPGVGGRSVNATALTAHWVYLSARQSYLQYPIASPSFKGVMMQQPIFVDSSENRSG